MNNQYFQQNGDGSSKPDTDNNNINNHQPTNNSDPLDKVARSQTSPPKKPSEARLRANRQNSQKSTGPKTPRGKQYSRRNAVKHGLLLNRLLFSDKGEPINAELKELSDRLNDRYGKGDIRTQLLVESLVVEHWRQNIALSLEREFFKLGADRYFSPQGQMPNLLRYLTASQRAFLKNLELLDQLPLSPSWAEKEKAEDP